MLFIQHQYFATSISKKLHRLLYFNILLILYENPRKLNERYRRRELYKVMFTEIRQKMIRYSNPFDIACNFKWNITELLKNLMYLHGITCDAIWTIPIFSSKITFA